MTVPPLVFADTSFYTAILNRRDAYHVRAVLWQQAVSKAHSRIFTTEAVLWEFLNSCAVPTVRNVAFAGYLRLHADPDMRVIAFEPALCSAALQMYASHRDKEWGITDCLSFQVMRQHGLDAALTADRHFQQAGFVALLLQDP